MPTPQTRAMLALVENLDSIRHMLKLSTHEVVMLAAQTRRLTTIVGNECDLAKTHWVTKPQQTQAKRVLAKLMRSLNRFNKTFKTRIERFQTLTLWQVVMLVTCVEAYLQDVLTTAACIDPELMRESEQRALYADVIGAASLETLANELRARWARSWLSDGGPTRWIVRLGKMGARDYPADLGPRLERFWGIRHVVVHAAGVATADFVKRHPGVVKAAGDRVRVNHHDYKKFLEAVRDFLDPTDGFFLTRYPSMLAVSTAPAK
jgi:hypothetical protein